MILYAGGYLLFAIALAAWLQWARPGWTATRRTLAVALPGPIALLIGGVAVALDILLPPTPAGRIDAGGIALLVMTLGWAFAAVLALAIGLTVAVMFETVGRK